MVKLNEPAAPVFNSTVNAAGAEAGSTVPGENWHGSGAPVVQLNVTVPLYPFSAVTVPLQITF
jgi:hypothetical protein